VESEAAFEGSVGLECPGCGTNIIVMPARLYTAIGDLSGVEGELQFGEVVRRKKAETGDSLAVADVDGAYTCPVCGRRGQLPPADKLRRLAKEQGGLRIFHDEPPAPRDP
jgi:predicted RNA-binding Zn-ribbon protein involved in translation (DUF1610 family)